MENILITNEG